MYKRVSGIDISSICTDFRFDFGLFRQCGIFCFTCYQTNS